MSFISSLVTRAGNGSPLTNAQGDANLTAIAAGMDARNPTYAATAIPTSNVGPIYVIGVGDMEWDAVNNLYRMMNPITGQCRLDYVSTTQIKLSPFGGNILVINGAPQRVPAAGITLAPTGLAFNTLYYIYAAMSAGAMILEASTTAFTNGVQGLPVKTGDATRALVGMVNCTAAAGAFARTAIILGVKSFYNRKTYPLAVAVSSTNASTTPIRVSSFINLLAWDDDLIRVDYWGFFSNDVTGVNILWGIYQNSVLAVQNLVTAHIANFALPLGTFYNTTGLIVGRVSNWYGSMQNGGGTTSSNGTFNIFTSE